MRILFSLVGDVIMVFSIMPAAHLGVPHPEIRLLAAAVGQREAARQMGISENTVKSICYRNGDGEKLTKAMVEKQENARHPNAPSAISALENTLSERKNDTRLHQSAYLARASKRLADVSDDQLLEHAPIGKTLAEMASKVYPETTVDQSTHLTFFSVTGARIEETVHDVEQTLEDPLDDY